jgi:hypothetical protein
MDTMVSSLRSALYVTADVAIAVTAGALLLVVLPLHYSLMGAAALVRPKPAAPPVTVRTVQ